MPKEIIWLRGLPTITGTVIIIIKLSTKRKLVYEAVHYIHNIDGTDGHYDLRRCFNKDEDSVNIMVSTMNFI